MIESCSVRFQDDHSDSSPCSLFIGFCTPVPQARMQISENKDLHFIAHPVAKLAVFLSVCLCANAQQATQKPASTQPGSENTEQVPRVAGLSTILRRFNAGVSYSGVHNSSVGWYELAEPAVSYTISRHYSVDASTLIYLHRLVENSNPGSGQQSNQQLVLDTADMGDTSIGVHGTYHLKAFNDTASAYLSAPTGDRSAGLGTGRVTFDCNNLTERYVKQTGFFVGLGLGDSSNLVSNLITQNYTSVGPLAHFQTGAIFWLMRRYYLQTLAYEDLPLGSQTVYTAAPPPGGNGGSQHPGSNTNIVTSTSASEDNGFTAQVGIPFTDHLTLSGYYNRSLRHHLDTASIGVTFVLRGTPKPKRLSIVDRALREAAGVSDK